MANAYLYHFHKTAEDIRLEGWTLWAKLKRLDGSWNVAQLRLNHVLGNDNVKFAWDGEKVGDSAKDPTLVFWEGYPIAIVWASATCNADIITMSFGFPRTSDIVEEAIVRAYARGTIMFAATRNDGGNKAIAYPANHHNVIGIASSDGLGNGSKFNPNAPEDDSSFFSTLGEAVESAWPRLPYTDENGNPGVADSKRRKSGTSFATPIAAALAANILDYARLKLDMGEKHL